MTEAVMARLFELRDEKYKEFNSSLIPTVDPKTVIGVRTPALRQMARELKNTAEAEEFLKALPHAYFEENNLHAFLIEYIKDFDKCLYELERFLPYVDNWATCDMMRPKALKKQPEKLLSLIDKWLASGETYTVRYAVGMLMSHFLDENFDISYAEKVASIESGEYYVNMMRAWYFATALAKQYEAVVPFSEEGRLDVWTSNKAIQKAVESRRITPEQKEYLKRFKRK